MRSAAVVRAAIVTQSLVRMDSLAGRLGARLVPANKKSLSSRG
jgi:hypothetical protein